MCVVDGPNQILVQLFDGSALYLLGFYHRAYWHVLNKTSLSKRVRSVVGPPRHYPPRNLKIAAYLWAGCTSERLPGKRRQRRPLSLSGEETDRRRLYVLLTAAVATLSRIHPEDQFDDHVWLLKHLCAVNHAVDVSVGGKAGLLCAHSRALFTHSALGKFKH